MAQFSTGLDKETFEDSKARPFFSGLLPEGEVRRTLARNLGISERNDFALLREVGGDMAGAISVTDKGDPLQAEEDPIRWFDEAELARTVAELPEHPLFIDPDQDVRLSLAGVQDKMPVIDRGGRVGVSRGHTPSTHILKAPISRFDDTVVNEAFCLRLAAMLGQTAVEATVRKAGEVDILLVRRYDRSASNAAVTRLHQEDFCQALGIPSDRKYQTEQGPGIRDCASLIRSASGAPAQDLLAFVDAVTFALLVGNHDAHGKNYSLLYTPSGTRLAPLYDLVSTVVYQGLSRKMAMKIGGEYRAGYVRRRHVDRMAGEADLGAVAVRRRMRRLALAAPDVAENLLQIFRDEGLDRPVLTRIVDLVRHRGHALEEELR